jgi:hypothetical protein
MCPPRVAYAQLGELDCGRTRLAQAVDERAGWVWIAIEPMLDPLRAGPRFDDLPWRVKLVPAAAPQGFQRVPDVRDTRKLMPREAELAGRFTILS